MTAMMSADDERASYDDDARDDAMLRCRLCASEYDGERDEIAMSEEIRRER